jgi:cytochrome c oxidase assembly protein subunit 11
LVQSRQRKNLQVVIPCVVVIATMLGLVAASPMLYRMYTAAVGLGVTPSTINADLDTVAKHTATLQLGSAAKAPAR